MKYERKKKYRRWEKGLETQEIKYINSAKMKRILNRLSKHFGFTFIKPFFRPVYLNKRLKAIDGQFCGDSIEIAFDSYTKKETLWHELLHSIVYDNYNKYYDENWSFEVLGRKLKWEEKPYLMRNKIEKAVFTIEGRGSHHTQNYKLLCDCGYWLKTVKKRTKTFCRQCGVYLVSPKEYRKLKKIAEINSTIVEIRIDNYKPWRENKRIGVKI